MYARAHTPARTQAPPDKKRMKERMKKKKKKKSNIKEKEEEKEERKKRKINPPLLLLTTVKRFPQKTAIYLHAQCGNCFSCVPFLLSCLLFFFLFV